MKYLVIYEYIEEVQADFTSKIELANIINIVSRGDNTIVNFKDGTIAEFKTANISLYFE